MKGKVFKHRLGFALAGLQAAWQSEKSFRTQVFFAVAAVILLLLVRPQPVWWALLGMMITLVLAAELFNTALEHLADHLHPEQHPTIKVAKDCAAAAVLVLSVAAAWVAALMLWSVWCP